MKPGIYAFKVYKPAGYPAEGSTFEWSEPMTLAKCDENRQFRKRNKASLQKGEGKLTKGYTRKIK